LCEWCLGNSKQQKVTMLSRFALNAGRLASQDGMVAISSRSASQFPWEGVIAYPTAEEQAAFTEKSKSMTTAELKAEYGKLAPAQIVEGPERDYKNFPTFRRLEDSPVRHGWIPESWFQSLYSTTGVTGPYVLMGTLGTFLMSKEYFIFSFETNILFTGLLFMTIVVKKLTPGTNELLKGLQKDEESVYVEYEQHCKGELQKTIDHYEKQIGNAEAIPMLYTAKRENVGLQLEAEYRERQQKVYSEVKRRLDYQVNTDNVKRRVEQQHMVNWIIDNVKKSITPETEKENLKACLTRLKGLSTA